MRGAVTVCPLYISTLALCHKMSTVLFSGVAATILDARPECLLKIYRQPRIKLGSSHPLTVWLVALRPS